MKKIFLFIAAFYSTFILLAQNGTEAVKVTDMLKIKTAGNITINPDGTKAAFTVTSIEPDEKTKSDYKYVTQIYMVNLDGSAPVQITHAKEGASQPAWSPDGKQLAFVRAIDGKPQIFILPMNGGEAYQLTKYVHGASAPHWLPDGQKIVFSSSISLKDLLKDSVLNPTHSTPLWDFEKPGLKNNQHLSATKAKANADGNMDEIRAYLLQDEADNKAKVFNKLNFQDESGTNNEISFTHIFITSVKQGAQPKEITHGFYRYGFAGYIPNSNSILIAANIDSVQMPDRALENEIYIANIDGSNLHLLLGKKGMSYGSAEISPNGKWIAYQAAAVATVSIPKLILQNLASGQTTDFTFDRNLRDMQWSKDGRYLYFIAQSNGGAPLYKLDISDPANIPKPLSDYNSGVTSYDIANDKIVFAKTHVEDPSEVYLADNNMQNVKTISSLNDWVKTKKLSLPEKHTFTNNQGMPIEYWVMKPINYEKGKKYPLLLEIHGGPSAMWGPGEASMWHEFQFFTSKGYGVVYCNPRGSGGYDEAFLRANINDWGTGPTSDVLTALDKTVAEGWADTSKLLVTGGSYAGYLVAWIVGHDHRFKAACSQRGVYDLATFFGEGNAWRLVPNYFGGYPWEPKVNEILVRESPVTYVNNITTPYIIFHGDNDRRTGFVQGEMMYRSLKVLGRPVEYVRHPGATHELTRSGDNRERIDQMLRTYEFFERWIAKK